MSTVSITEKPYALLFQALSNLTRMRILQLLYRRRAMSVSEICEELDLEQTQVSHNLRCLTFCGLLRVKREGKNRLYSLNEETLLPLFEIANAHLKKYASNLLSCDALER